MVSLELERQPPRAGALLPISQEFAEAANSSSVPGLILSRSIGFFEGPSWLLKQVLYPSD